VRDRLESAIFAPMREVAVLTFMFVGVVLLIGAVAWLLGALS
jgi:hypothetical protein